jgi:hypothetical protein
LGLKVTALTDFEKKMKAGKVKSVKARIFVFFMVIE